MARLTQLSLHLTFGLAFSGFAVAPVMAQDLGTYRPGQAYQSVTSPGADVCNSHCAGDAQCRAWNYVKVNPKAPGVCEFLATASEPVQSPISISGENINQTSFTRPLSQAGTNTVRVGTAVTPKAAAPRVTRPAPNRRVVREAVPQRINPQATADIRSKERRGRVGGASLTEQQNQYRRQTGNLPAAQQPRQNPTQRLQQRQAAIPPQNAQRQNGQYPNNRFIGAPQPQFPQRPTQQFKPFLDNANPRTAAPQNPQALREQLRQNQARQLQAPQNQAAPYPTQGRAAPNYPVQNRSIRAGQPRAQRRRQAGGRPPVGQPIGQPIAPTAPQNPQYSQSPNRQAAPRQGSASLPRASAQAPVTHQNAQAAFAKRQADLAAIASGNSVDPIQKSLYGTLNDDVKVPAISNVRPADPDAPIVTAASRPIAPVQTQPLGQLAGGPR